jgi:uncharacterized protein with PQ loop repeat
MKIDLLSVLSLVGAGMGMLLCLSPVPAFIRASKTNSVKEISRSFVMVSNLMAVSWVLYAYKANILDIVVPNVLQCSISLTLIAVYHHLNGDPVLAIVKYCSLLSIVSTLALRLGDVEILGVVAVVFNTLSNLAPMDQVAAVIKERRADYLDMNVNCASFLYNCIWLGFGLVSHNHYVTLPNAFGLCCSLFLFGLYVWAKSKACWPVKKEVDETSSLA